MDENEIEAAELAETNERERTIARIRDRLAVPGEEDCIACGDPIPEARRAAMPSARRCAPCQAELESGGRRHA